MAAACQRVKNPPPDAPCARVVGRSVLTRKHAAPSRWWIVGASLFSVASLFAQTPRDFLTGADISYLPAAEKQGARFFDANGSGDLLDMARRGGWTVLRVRLWVAPDAKPESAVSNLENVTLLGRRIKAAGFKFLLDLHYSDTWADPGHQAKPAAWKDLDFPRLVQQVHDYSREVVTHLRENGALPDMVQIGNETKNGLLYGSGLNGAGPAPGGGFRESDGGGVRRALQLFDAGISGVREGAPQNPPLTMLHLPDGQDPAFIKSYVAILQADRRSASPALRGDFDVIGLSYYPAKPWNRKIGFEPWHLPYLTESMNDLATTLHKPLMVVETAWPQAGTPQPMPGAPEHPFTPDGQVQFYQNLLQAVREVPQGLGQGVVLWTAGPTDWDFVCDAHGKALPALQTLGQK